MDTTAMGRGRNTPAIAASPTMGQMDQTRAQSGMGAAMPRGLIRRAAAVQKAPAAAVRPAAVQRAPVRPVTQSQQVTLGQIDTFRQQRGLAGMPSPATRIA